VGDSAIADVAAIVPRDGRVILHASASAGLDALRPHEERGVLHPLMTFPGPEIGLPPLAGAGAAVAGSPRALAVATELASRLGMVAFPLPGNPAGYHAAATMASGHLGAVFLVAVEAAIAAGVPADRAAALLLPLASESLRRVASAGGGALTGPAARGDEQAMAAHLAAVPDAVRPFYVSGVVEIGRLRRGSVKS
jgi:predicted short-subunit dehydrogenase-like oxidoreductase (DUF2520 family)